MDYFGYENSEYNDGIGLEEYNGTYSLVSSRMGNDGKVYMRWCYPQGAGKGAGPIARAIPWKIRLGSRDEAIKMINRISAALNGGQVADGDDIPF